MAQTLDELRAHDLAHRFKLEIYRLLRSSPEALRDWKFRAQLANAASGGPMNIAEGFRRFVPAEFSRFLGYALSSLEEAVRRVKDGADRGYYSVEDANAWRSAWHLRNPDDRQAECQRSQPDSGRASGAKARRTMAAEIAQVSTHHRSGDLRQAALST
jgi:four helix bundle protein